MNELLNKLSSYNVFNYLLPGIVFAVLANKVIRYSVGQHEVFTAAFLYYFVGLVVSRFGSLIVEPVLKFISLVKFADYGDFVAASKDDQKLDVLSEVNNTYRTFCSVFILLLLLKLYVKLENRIPALSDWNVTILAALLLVLFVFSYRKQTAYIAQRINTRE